MAIGDPGEAVFRHLAEAAPDALAVHHDGLIIWANRATRILLGGAEDSNVVGRPIVDFVEPSAVAALKASLARSASSNAPQTYVAHLRSDSGVRHDVELTRIPMADGLMLVVARNLELERTAEARTRAFFEVSTAAMGISRVGVHLETNLAYARLFGFEHPDELVGKPILDLIDPSEHPKIQERVRRRALGELVPNHYETIGRRRDGSSFALAVDASSYVDGSDTITVVVMSDVSASRARAEQLAHQQRLESIGRLAGGVAHDFNNLLAAILANVDLSLLTVPSKTVHHDALTTIREASLRARDLVRQVLTFGRRDQPKPQPVDVGQAVSEALALARTGLRASVQLTVAIEPGVGTVLIDPTQLHQVVINLVSNAGDAVGANGHIEVSVASVVEGSSRRVRLRVKDDGEGMSERTRAHLFEPYHTTKADRGGHGLGLAVVQGIVASAGGRIEVESAPGQGARFDVVLPLTSAEREVRFTPAPAPPGQGVVLVVDDEALVLRGVARVVRSLGYEVLEASGAEQALELLGRSKVDVVLSDVSMPGRSGVELAREVEKLYPKVRVVLCTGFAAELSEPMPASVKAMLAKPVGRKEIGLALSTAFIE